MSSSSVSTLCGSTLKRGTSGSSNFLHWLGHCFQTKRALVVKFLYPASYSKVFRFTIFPMFRSMCRVLVLQDLTEQRSLLLGNSPYQSVQRPLSRPEGSKKSTIVMFMVQQRILIARVCTVGVKGSGSLARSLICVPTFRIPSFRLGALKSEVPQKESSILHYRHHRKVRGYLWIWNPGQDGPGIGDKGFGRGD